MTYAPHIRLQVGGPLFDTEIWSMTFNMRIGSQNVDPTSPVLDLWEEYTRDQIQDVRDDFAAYIADPTSTFSRAAGFGFTKYNVIGADGKYRNPGETVAIYETDPRAVRGNLTAGPAQTALCVSTLTAKSRGRGTRGRFYLPCGAIGVDAATGRVAAGVVTDALGAAQRFVDALNNQPGLDANNPRVVIVSNLGQPGPFNDVTALAIGNVLDTQRRRRNQLPETYTEAPVTIR